MSPPESDSEWLTRKCRLDPVLDLIRAYLIENLPIDREDFEDLPVFTRYGGWGRADRDSDGKLPQLLWQMNEAMAAQVRDCRCQIAHSRCADGGTMTCKRFEELPVWNDAVDLSVAVFELTADRSSRFPGDLTNQLQRAALSVPNNIAEGFDRGSMRELISFLYYARGSAGEVRSILSVAERLRTLRGFHPQFADLRRRAEAISPQIAGWLACLRDSSVTGDRSLAAAQRTQRDRTQRAERFVESLRRTVAESQAAPHDSNVPAARSTPDTSAEDGAHG